MTTSGDKERHYFDLAFELAYFIHANKEVAFFVAEDALDGLGSMLGCHEKNRRPVERLRGFLKSGERTRPIRKTIKLNEPQMLQWLVYKQSEVWERQTERGEGSYLPTEEDLIVRYLEHLVFITLRRGSFYVTLAVGPLLHQFDRRETRLSYDILTQSDSARMKDTNYIGKQRLEMLERVSRRFGDMIRTVNRPGDEKQFVVQPTTQWVIDLVSESLRRFTPWETSCVVEPGFDITDIPGLYFSETSAHDEEIIEMNRIHTILDPVCFATFANGLSRYVRTLPDEDKDKASNYDSLDERLKVPQFSNFPCGPSRGDRFQSPKLTNEDYVRLQRTLDARAHRRKVFIPQQLCIYIDDVLTHSFDPKMWNRGRWLVGPETAVVEVRGKDTVGELTLATFLLGDDQVPGGTFRDSVVHAGGQKVTIWLTPALDAEGAVKGAQLEVSYQPPGLGRPVSQLARRVWFGITGMKEHDKVLAGLQLGHAWGARTAVAVALLFVTSALIWWQLGSPWWKIEPREQPGQPQGDQQVAGMTPVASVTPSPLPKQSPALKEVNPLVARATWSEDREAALRAIPLEPTRGEIRTIDLSRREIKLPLSVPVYDDQGRTYSRYRLTLSAAEKRLWQQTLRAPKVSLTGYAHILDLLLFTQRLSATGPYDLQVEGSIQGVWQPLGKVSLSPKEQRK